MFASEKKSLWRFLLIYISSSLVLFALGLVIFFNYEKHRIIDNQNTLLKAQSTTLIPQLKELHSSQKHELTYPHNTKFLSALYDVDKNFLFGDFRPQTIHLNKEFYQKNDTLFCVQKVSPYYLGTAFIVIKKTINYIPIQTLKTQLTIAFIVAMFFITIIAYWLGKLFLSPMRNSIKLLDDFIKDATHEINTPLTTIVTNAELLKSFHPELNNSKELYRIETASKRLSCIYDDLAYIRLNHKRHHNIEKVNISEFLNQRVDYFKSIADAKAIEFTYNITKNIFLTIDREDLTRIIDNLLGNAFKYTMLKGKVKVTLDKEKLSIQDNGIGIDEDSKKEVLQRFVRANKSEGGFGLGLSIVSQIAKYYNFTIKLQSEINKGTKVSILWKK